MPQPPDYPLPGEPIRAEWGIGLVDFIRHLSSIVGPGLKLDRSSRKATLSIDESAIGVMIGITQQVITARSGTTLGHGKVTIRVISASTWNTSAGQTFDCGNWTGGTIPSGSWVAVRYADGRPVITSAEC